MAEPNLKNTKSNETNDKCSIEEQTKHLLNNAALISQMALDIKDRCHESEACITKLKNLTITAYKSVNSIKSSSRSFLLLAHKLTLSSIMLLDTLETDQLHSIRDEFEKLLMVLEKELSDIYDIYSFDNNFYQNLNDVPLKQISEKIRQLEDRQRHNDCVHPSNNSKNFKTDFNDKYPEKISNENVLNLDSNLTPVPENMCASFAKPMRSSSLSSLKDLSKEVTVKLQQDANVSDDDDDSDAMEDFNLARINYGDRNFSSDNSLDFVDISE